MSKILQVSVLLGLLFCLTAGQHLLTGYTFWDTTTDGSSQCFEVISGDLGPHSSTDPELLFTVHQSFRLGPNADPMAPPAGCKYHSYYPDSFFYGDSFDPNMVFFIWQNDSNSDFIVEASLFTSAIEGNNGSTGVLLPQSDQPSLQQYVCKTFFDVTPVDIAVWGTGSPLVFQNPSSDDHLVFIEDVLDSRVISLQANTITKNTSFPNIVASLFDACASTVSSFHPFPLV